VSGKSLYLLNYGSVLNEILSGRTARARAILGNGQKKPKIGTTLVATLPADYNHKNNSNNNTSQVVLFLDVLLPSLVVFTFMKWLTVTYGF